MRKLLVIFLISSLISCEQRTASPYWPEDQKEVASSGVVIPSMLTLQQQQNLDILCRVWGFIKYFHPKVAEGEVNADKALFAILPSVLNAPGKNELQDTLFSWVEHLGDIPSNEMEMKMPNVFIEPQMGWLKKDSLISGKFRLQLLHVLKNRHRGEGYYIKKKRIGNPDFSNELKYEKITGEDGGMRILTLFRYWNMIEYFFPSKYLTADNWDEVLIKFIPQFAISVTDSAYRNTCCKLVASIHDSHAAGVRYNADFCDYAGRYSLPWAVAEVEGSMTVLYHFSDAFKNNPLLQPGDRILAINGVDVKKMIDSIKPYIQASNNSSLVNSAMNKLCTGNLPNNKLTIARANNIIELNVPSHVFDRSNVEAPKRITSIYPMYQTLGDDIGYINLEKIKAASLPEIFKQFEQTKGLIIDIRNYPSQFVPFALGKCLKPLPSPFVRFTMIDLDMPGRFLMLEPLENGEVNPSYYKGKIVILVNAESISQSEYTAMALRSAPNAVIMGSQTSGADGDVSGFFLPGGLFTLISGLGVYYPDKRVTQGIGIVPDIEVKPTIKGISAGKDELLETAMKYIRADQSK